MQCTMTLYNKYSAAWRVDDNFVANKAVGFLHLTILLNFLTIILQEQIQTSEKTWEISC